MKRKQPPATEYTLKMSTTNADARYKEFFVREYATGWCTGNGRTTQCPILPSMSVKTARKDELSPEQVSTIATNYIYKCEWLKSGKCSNPFGTGCPSGQLYGGVGNNSPVCVLPDIN